MSTDAVAVHNSFFGSSKFVYWNSVQCSGSEDRLIECRNNPIPQTDFYCGHGLHAGVRCIGMFNFFTVSYALQVCYGSTCP